MRVVRLDGRSQLRHEHEPDPEAPAGHELVRVTAVGLCGSDRHWYLDGAIGDATMAKPVVPGHELAGVIVGGTRDGLRVVVDPAVPCGLCGLCLSGREHLCPDVRFAGHGDTDGGLREYLEWPADRLVPTPDTLDDGEAALLEPLGVALHAIDLGHVRPATAAGVYGCGPIGLLIVQVLRHLGCFPIVATDRLPHRVEAARRFGATHARLVDEDGVVDGPSVDVAFEVAGEDAALADAVGAVKPGSRVVVVGIPSDDRTSFRASVVRRKELVLLHCRRMTADDLVRAAGLAGDGAIELGPMITQRYALGQADRAFASLIDRTGLKTIVEPSR